MEEQTAKKEKSFEIIQIVKEAWELNCLKGVKLGIWKIMAISFIITFLLNIVFGIINFAILFVTESLFITTPISIIIQSCLLFIQVSFTAIIIKCSANVIKQKNDATKSFYSFYNINYKLNKNVILTFLGILLGLNLILLLIGLTNTHFISYFQNFNDQNFDPKDLIYIASFIIFFICVITIFSFLTGVFLPFSLINAYEKNAKTYEETFHIIKETFKVTIKHFFSYISLSILVFLLFAVSFVIIGLTGYLLSFLLSTIIGTSFLIKLFTIILAGVAILIIFIYLVPLLPNIFAVAYTKENFDSKLEKNFYE